MAGREGEAMRLNQIEWEGGNSLEMLSRCGVDPLQETFEILAEKLDDTEDRRINFLVSDIRDRLIELDETVYRF